MRSRSITVQARARMALRGSLTGSSCPDRRHAGGFDKRVNGAF
jgi:hypothetical protein